VQKNGEKLFILKRRRKKEDRWT